MFRDFDCDLRDPIDREWLSNNPIDVSVFLLLGSDSFAPACNYRYRNVRIAIADRSSQLLPNHSRGFLLTDRRVTGQRQRLERIV